MNPHQQTLLDLATRAEGVAGADRQSPFIAMTQDQLYQRARFERNALLGAQSNLDAVVNEMLARAATCAS